MPSFLRLCAALILPCCLLGAEPLPVDEDLPQPFDFDSKVMNEMRMHSPFNRFVSLEDTIQLTGVAYINGKPMATLVNKETKQRFVVSNEPNSMGWTLTEATLSDEPSKTEVHLMVGTDEVVLHYGEVQLHPGSAAQGKAELSTKKRNVSPTPPSGGPKINLASLLGEKGKELVGALSPESREKLTSILEASQAKHPERSADENSAIAKKIYTKMIAAESKPPNSGSPKTAKPPKPRKQK